MTDVYLVGNWETGGVDVQCERDECRVPGDCVADLCWWREELPYRCTAEDAAVAVAAHLATHNREETRA